ncbi:ABC transporter family substrate-binding protein [Plantibacter sp. YIM 135347]|uniref:ABC transporter family substrate-binding protein n=1 Tax=Plantibacter sp. YIM 135347 TaxID=3423919 RepID=UPI003D327CAE
MRSKRTRGMILATVSIAALALTACTGGGSTGGSPSSASADLPGTGWTRADAGDVADGGSLKLAVDAIPANWNLYNLDSGTVDDQFLTNIYTAAYVNIKEDGTWEANKDFAESVELKSDDPQVVEIKINPKAVWSDGTPMSVDDFISSWKSLNGVDPAYAPTATNVWKDISSVEAGDGPQDVLMTFANKNADWPSILQNIWPKWLGDTPEHFNTLWAKGPFAADGTTYVSGGPYIVSKIDQTGAVVTFEPNPKWWGDKPKLDSIIFKQVSRAGLAQAFANSELDVFSIGTNSDNYQTAQKRSDAEIQRSRGTIYSHVTLNGTTDILSDVNVRQAFAKSLNREVLAQARLSGIDAPVQLLNNLIFLPGQDGYEDDASKVIGYDLDGAKKQLDEAGWKEGSGGIREKDGKKLSVRYVIDSDNPVSAETSQQIQAQAKEAGFDVKIDTVPSDDFFTKYVTTETRDFDAVSFSWQGTAFPISSTESIFYPADSGQNFPGVTDDSLGDLWAKANAELDPAKRLDIAKDIDKKIVALATTIPLFPVPFTYGVKTGLVNYGPTQFETIDWQHVGWKK